MEMLEKFRDDNGWQSVEDALLQKFEKPGDVFCGIFDHSEPVTLSGKPGTAYYFTLDGGQFVKIHGTADLNKKLRQVPPGHLVRIKYLGDDADAAASGTDNAMKVFQVQHKK
jgi:hypothetical protein